MAESYVDVPEGELPTGTPRRTPNRSTMLDDVSSDLAYWIDDTATKVALAFAPGRAPFAAQITEAQKLEFYTRALFNPDGSPNQAGRAKEVARLGPEGFSNVYKAVLTAHPELKPAQPAVPDSIDALAPAPPPPVPGPPMGLPMMPGGGP